jgi:uncharacterized protein (DUF4415 family)
MDHPGHGFVFENSGRRLRLEGREYSHYIGTTGNTSREATIQSGRRPIAAHGMRQIMKQEYNFSKGKRGPVVSVPKGKTRITIRLDDDILDWFRRQVETAGGNYQSLINDALREYLRTAKEPLETILRRVIREELTKAS